MNFDTLLDRTELATQVIDLQRVIGTTFSCNFSSTGRGELVAITSTPKGPKALWKEVPSPYNCGKKTVRPGVFQLSIMQTWNAFFF
jgi:hypothetical protein